MLEELFSLVKSSSISTLRSVLNERLPDIQNPLQKHAYKRKKIKTLGTLSLKPYKLFEKSLTKNFFFCKQNKEVLFFAKTLIFALKFFVKLSFKKVCRFGQRPRFCFCYSISAFVPPAKFKSTHSAVLKCLTLMFCKNTSMLFALSSNVIE